MEGLMSVDTNCEIKKLNKFFIFFILLVLTFQLVKSAPFIQDEQIFDAFYDRNPILEITDFKTDPLFPLENNGSTQNVLIKFSSNALPLNVEINLYNSTDNIINTQIFYVDSDSYLPLTYQILQGLKNGNYTLWISFNDFSGKIPLLIYVGNITVTNPVIMPSVSSSVQSHSSSQEGSCSTLWRCSEFSACVDGVQSRSCEKTNPYCNSNKNQKPSESQSCHIDSENNSLSSFENTVSRDSGSLLTGRAVQQLVFEKAEITKGGTVSSMALSIFLIPEYFLFKIGRKKKKIKISPKLARFELFLLVLVGAILIGTSNFIAFSNVL